MWTVRRPDGTVATGWLLAPLRLFLGATFLFAGMQKLADPNFLKVTSPTSIHAQLLATAHSSPIHVLTNHLLPYSTAVGLAIAIGEIAIGVGVLVGLWMRWAALAGMALSLGLFLTVSFHASPYYTGSDIVFFFAWTPLLLAGAAGAPAVDTWLEVRSGAAGGGGSEVSRRAVLSKGAATGIAAGAVVVLGGLSAAIGRWAGGTTTASAGQPAGTLPPAGPSTTTATSGAGPAPTTQPAQPSGVAIGPAASVPVGGSASFTDPKSTDPSVVIQLTAGDFVAYDAICPHQGCTVAYQTSARIIACPCHGSEFDPKTGAVTRGPAPTGLTRIKVTEGSNGDLYVPG
jgi:thiosulfate dehydrogenase (quinone) large subunit